MLACLPARLQPVLAPAATLNTRYYKQKRKESAAAKNSVKFHIGIKQRSCCLFIFLTQLIVPLSFRSE
jgi:hypothetical protein